MDHMKKLFICFVALCLLAGCSTSGGIYKSGDPQHGEFSPGRTALTILGVAAAVSAARGGGGGAQDAYAWDYQPGNGQWVCRNKFNGQYANASNCEGLPLVDGWR